MPIHVPCVVVSVLTNDAVAPPPDGFTVIVTPGDVPVAPPLSVATAVIV